MSQKTRIFLLGFAFWAFAYSLDAQRLLTADTTHRCIYSGHWFADDILMFEPEASVTSMVDEILRAGNLTGLLSIEVAYARVPIVAGIIEGDKNYLLYNKSFFANNKQNQALLYFLLAHEIGHFNNKHKIAGDRLRVSEETEADEFAGFVLRKVESVSKEEVHKAIRTTPFSYKVGAEARIEAFNAGWNRADAHLKGQGGGNSFYEDGMRDASLPLPSFTWPPPPQYTSHVLPKTLYEPKSVPTLGHIDEKICRALDSKGYSQRSYYCVPNGFALVTQLEQFNKAGTSKSEEARWLDYPVQDNFDGLWSYLKALVTPSVGNFRVFVFVVSDKTFSQQLSKSIPIKEAEGWIGRGGRWLPDAVANIQNNTNYRVTVLVYEFETSQANRASKQKHPCLLTGQKHLETSGLLNAIPK
jgi:hypothetical protein